MTIRIWLFVGLVLLFAASPKAQRDRGPVEVLLDVLVWGMHMGPLRPDAYPDALRVEVDAYLRRATGYQSPRPAPPTGGLADMVYEASVGYERRLAAVSADPDASRLAVEYVDNLRPCYEWEGSRVCPEREALFADEYQSAHPNGPFSQFLPLLSGHRWLCVAQSLNVPLQDADRARQLSRDRLAVAIQSRALLVRVAALRLAVRDRCDAS